MTHQATKRTVANDDPAWWGWMPVPKMAASCIRRGCKFERYNLKKDLSQLKVVHVGPDNLGVEWTVDRGTMPPGWRGDFIAVAHAGTETV